MKPERVPLSGVVGWPIAHSMSPLIHGYWLQKHQIKGQYVPLGIEPQKFEEVLKVLPDLGFLGVNVTIPFKERALKTADRVTDRAALIGAANMLTFKPDGSILADNSDGIGFVNNIKQSVPSWDASAGPAIVLGAGGAARAVIAALLAEGAPQVFLSNRTVSRAEALQAHFGERVIVSEWDSTPGPVSEAATIVNSTSLGMVGQPPLQVNLDTAQATVLVTDIVYNPLRTKFLEQACSLGLSTVDGLGMLLFQAVPGFESWFGGQVTVDDALRELILGSHG